MMMQGQGHEVPNSVNMQAMYDAEEAELQKAIEESKAMMELMQIADDQKPTPKKEEPKPVVIKKEEPQPDVIQKEEPKPVVIQKEEPKPVVIKKEEPKPFIQKE